MSSPSSADPYRLDTRVVRRAFDRASAGYERAAIVQAEIRSRLLERLEVVRLQPHTVLDLGAATGQSSRALSTRYPKSQVIALDLSSEMLLRAARQQRLLRRFLRVAGDAHALPLRSETVELVFSNLMLAWCNDPDTVFQETARVLRPDGLFMFATLGPDTLKELREAFRNVDAHTHVHRFIDMHDLGDALMRSGFIQPVMDTERLTVTYPSLRALMQELQAGGAGNATLGRRRTLLGRGQFHSLERHITRDATGPLGFTIEVVYGHAWRGAPAVRRPNPHEFFVPLTRLKRR